MFYESCSDRLRPRGNNNYITIFYRHVLIASINSLSLIELCLILFENLLYCVHLFDSVYCVYKLQLSPFHVHLSHELLNTI